MKEAVPFFLPLSGAWRPAALPPDVRSARKFPGFMPLVELGLKLLFERIRIGCGDPLLSNDIGREQANY